MSRGREFYVLDTGTRQTRRIHSVLRDTLGPPRLTRDGRYARRSTESDVWLVNLQTPQAGIQPPLPARLNTGFDAVARLLELRGAVTPAATIALSAFQYRSPDRLARVRVSV